MFKLQNFCLIFLILYWLIYFKCCAEQNYNLSAEAGRRNSKYYLLYENCPHKSKLSTPCECTYVSSGINSDGGCKIKIPAPEGYRCQCIYNEWEHTCTGISFDCCVKNNPDACPSNCTSRDCCLAGSRGTGNCDGYSSPWTKITSGLDSKLHNQWHKNRDSKLTQYKTCMKKNGIAAHRIIDPVLNPAKYKIVNFQWNRMHEQVYPTAYFQPHTVRDVQASIWCGSVARLPQVPNSGGHSYAALSFGSNETLILDMRNMNSIEINTEGNSVAVGPGAFIGHVNAYLWRNGGYGTPLGNCMTVAMGGHGIGGGIGYFAGVYGLVIDNMLEMTVVDASGRALTVNATQNQDLWWAMRGVGPGYIGVVTSYKLKLFQASDIKLTFARIRFATDDFVNVLPAYTKWLKYAEENVKGVFSVIFIVSDHFKATLQPLHPGMEVQILHIQDPLVQPEDNTKFLQAFPKFFPPNGEVILAYPSYLDFVLKTGYAPVVLQRPGLGKSRVPKAMGRLDDPLIAAEVRSGIYNNHLDFLMKLTKDVAWPRYFNAKSFYVTKSFDSSQLRDVQEVLQRIPKQTVGVMITSEGGAIGRPASNEMAYVHRDALYNLRIHYEGTNPEDVPEGKAWFKEFWNVTRFMDSGETYQNFPDLEDSDYLKRFYGKNLNKLIDIKKKWDPTGYFKSKMSIPIRK